MSQLTVVTRTHRIMVPDGRTGTAFMLDIDKRQYVITARHLLNKGISPFRIFFGNAWQSVDVGLVGHCEDDIDISVLHSNHNIPKLFDPDVRNLGIETDLKLGEEIRFFGFPHGLSTFLSSGRNQVALIKQGIISGFFGDSLGSGTESFIIDGHNNPGFSGGPVVSIRKGIFKVAGVISSYRINYQDVYGVRADGKVDKDMVVGYLPENTGITFAYNIKPALDIISKNPVGLSLLEHGR